MDVSTCWRDATVGGVKNPGDPVRIQGLECIFAAILNAFMGLVGIAVLVMLIAGGYQFMTAGGNRESIAKAGKTITFAVVGIVVLILCWFILRLISGFTGLEDILLKFKTPGLNPSVSL